MSDDTYNTQSPSQPNPAPFQSGYIAKDFNKIPDRNNASMSSAAPPPPHFSQQNYVPPPPPYPPAYAQVPPPYQPSYPPVYMQAPPPQRAGCFGFFLRSLATVCVVLVCFFLLILGGLFCIGAGVGALMSLNEEGTFKFEVPEKQLSESVIEGNAEADKKIAVISIEGVIAGEHSGYIAKQIKQAQKDRHVVAVILRIESPGGTLSGSDYYHHLLTKMKGEQPVPVIVSMGAVAASGGYYLAVAGDEIYAEPTTITGSIGVIVSLFNGEELCKKIGVASTPITSGPLKAMGGFTKAMSEEERKVWQNLVDDSFSRFKQIIRDGRKEFADNPEKLDKLATGQIYTAKEALDNKLIDKIGFMDDAIESARVRANVSERDCKVIRYKKQTGFFQVLPTANSSDTLLGSKTLSETLSEKTTPKIYAICPYVVP